ncbi:MAG: hypothetical protein KJ904_14820 [Alphaproteobacteria bacterium]|nr:hypothetical protein [Alphaproteobacteria bacterium]MBU0798469.1 hypothetical protein [Alphaproteobacteria bacterium]MBU0888427.1 hypothetical protein [Alphaproteobacteria bacterium]MBU1814738.1 hypothetical protein [Alphaproteobacteria bacterium]
MIPELLTTLQEIWVGFAGSRESGRVGLHRRYVKLIDTGRRGEQIALAANAEGGFYQALTFFRGDVRSVASLQTVLRVLGGGFQAPARTSAAFTAIGVQPRRSSIDNSYSICPEIFPAPAPQEGSPAGAG